MAVDLQSLESVSRYSEADAIRIWCVQKNRRIQFPLLISMGFTCLIMTLTFGTDDGGMEQAIPSLLAFLLTMSSVLLLFRLGRLASDFEATTLFDRGVRLFERHFRTFTIGYPVVVTGLMVLTARYTEDFSPFVLVMPWVVLAYRLSASDRWLVHVGLVLVSFMDGRQAVIEEFFWPALVINGIVLALGLLLNRRARGRFLIGWRAARERGKEQLRMQQELEYAREVQLSMLPHEPPALSWLEVTSLSIPATEVGGDYYDFFTLDEDRLLVVIGDVAGHGLASGLVLASIRSGLTLLVDDIEDTPRVMERLSRMLRETSRTRVLVSLAIIVVDRRQKTATITSAGHPPALLWRREEGRVEAIDIPALPLGTGLLKALEPREVPLQPGDTLVLYTDGVFEASDAVGEAFGIERLGLEIERGAEEPLDDLKASILQAVWNHQDSQEQEDDITMVMMRLLDTA